MNTSTTAELASATSAFVASVLDDPSVVTFRAAEQAMETDPEFTELRDRYNEHAERFQQKQADGTLEQDDIAAIRELQNRINSHPVAERYIAAREEIAALVRDCNKEISAVLGFDFGSAAGPRGGCSC